MKHKKIDKYYKIKAQEFIDVLFDKQYFSSNVTRKDLRLAEKYLAFLFQSYCDSAVLCSSFTRQIEKENNL